ncbi:hypothetical protein SAY87_014377 [Trapa incisa]|uniref:Uncharacterized protein n=1 Tax=Trapa incisa TaxID=236973 RepID=A0AAN7GJV9_9MYRT|nr:hypothetical protein SAY87_014377 [Trapa incisa]
MGKVSSLHKWNFVICHSPSFSPNNIEMRHLLSNGNYQIVEFPAWSTQSFGLWRKSKDYGRWTSPASSSIDSMTFGQLDESPWSFYKVSAELHCGCNLVYGKPKMVW